MIIKYNFDVLKKNVTLLFRVAAKRENLTQGYGSRCSNGQYVLFLDYDSTPYDWIVEEIRLLQQRYTLGTAYTFSTKHGYHVVFLEKFFIGEIVDMMNVTTCDKNYKEIPLYYGRRIWVLRHSDKKNETIKYREAVHTNHPDVILPVRSLAHKTFLQKNFKIPEKDFAHGSDYDNNKELTLAFYKIPEAQQ